MAEEIACVSRSARVTRASPLTRGTSSSEMLHGDLAMDIEDRILVDCKDTSSCRYQSGIEIMSLRTRESQSDLGS